MAELDDIVRVQFWKQLYISLLPVEPPLSVRYIKISGAPGVVLHSH